MPIATHHRIHTPAILWLSVATIACGSANQGSDDRGAADAGFTDPGASDAAVTDAGVNDGPYEDITDAATLPDAASVELAVCALGGDYSTISAAIAAAAPDSIILVCPGIYAERLTIDKRLQLRSTGGADATILDAGGIGSAIRVLDVPGDGVTIAGFTIRHGVTSGKGGGLSCENSSLHLLDSVVDSNQASGGGGLSATQCVLDLQRTRFVENSANGYGGGALLSACSGSIVTSTFENNSAGGDGGGLAIVEGDLGLHESTVSSNHAFRGGGLYHASDAAVENNTFADNVAAWTGGGVFVRQHEPTLSGNTITGNTAPNDGGGVYFDQSFGALKNNVVAFNWSGDDGGGVRSFESGLRIEHNQVHDNTAVDGGGGIRISHWPCEIYDNDIRDNSAGGAGGGLDLDNDSSFVSGGVISGNTAGRGGGIHASTFPYLGATLQNILVTDNDAWLGGGIQLEDNFQAIAMRGLTVTDNQAGHGGGIYIGTTAFTIAHSTIAGNTSSNEGGGVLIGGAVDAWTDTCPCPPAQATGKIDFSVVHDNTAVTGSGLWARSPTLSVANSIWSSNSTTTVTAVPLNSTSTSVPAMGWNYNDAWPATFVGMTSPTGSLGNIAVDPIFVDPIGNDYHLSSSSPCINAGDPAILDEDGSRSDMGAYGGQEVLP